MNIAMNRRAFLSATSSALAIAALGRAAEQADSRPFPLRPTYGRVGSRGIGPAAAGSGGSGEVVTLDGRKLPVRYEGDRELAPGKSVWLSPDADGVFSILYAEV